MSEATVTVDGKPVGVLRALELPPSLKARRVKVAGGEVVRYPIGDWLASLGVDVARVRAAHFYGGARVSALAGDEVRRLRGRLTFGFTQGDRGKARLIWPTEPVDVATTIDMITGVAVYVDQEPPALGVAYEPRERANGTRVYVDGALVATLKRKALTDDMLAGGEAGRFSLAAYLTHEGALAKGTPRAVDFLSGDDVIDRLDARAAKGISFTVPSHSHGRISVDLPIDAKTARVSAIELFVRTAPPARRIDPSAAVAAPNEDHAPGSGHGTDDEM